MSRRPRPTASALDRRRLRAAAVAGVVLLVAAYFASVRDLPFTQHFEIRGEFATSNQLVPGDLVRRAGVNIGKITGVEAGPGNTSIVKLRIDDHYGLHANASLAIKPRLLFEGNFYVDVRPGSPAAPPLANGATIPRGRTRVPVQLDQVLSTLDTSAREALTGSIDQLSSGLGGPSGARGSDGLRRAADELDGALVSVRRAARGMKGTRPGDLHRAVGSGADFTAELARDPAALAELVADFDSVAGALSADQASLSASVRGFDELLRVAPSNLRALDSALPTLTRFADELRPGLKEAPASLTATSGLLRQIRLLAATPELPAFVRAAEPVTRDLPSLTRSLSTQLTALNRVGQCFNNTLLPAVNTKIPDGPNSTDRPVWQDTLHLGANLLGSSAGFDANGGTLRLGLSEGVNALQEFIPGIGEVVGYGQFEGVNPIWLGAATEPEFRPDVWCDTQKIPDYGARSRIGRPTQITERKVTPVSDAEVERQGKMMRLLRGDKDDRRQLLQMLLKRLDLGKKPAPATTAPSKPADKQQPSVATSTPTPSAPSSAPKPAPQGTTPSSPLAPVLKGVGDALGDILGGLLGRRNTP